MQEEKTYCVDIVASRSHTLYIGVTGDLVRRVMQHKLKTYEGFSAQYNCNRLVWFERFVGPEAAIAREKQLKGWVRRKKIALIEKMNPAWVDLSEEWYAVDPSKPTRATAGPSTAQGAKSAPRSAQDDKN